MVARCRISRRLTSVADWLLRVLSSLTPERSSASCSARPPPPDTHRDGPARKRVIALPGGMHAQSPDASSAYDREMDGRRRGGGGGNRLRNDFGNDGKTASIIAACKRWPGFGRIWPRRMPTDLQLSPLLSARVVVGRAAFFAHSDAERSCGGDGYSVRDEALLPLDNCGKRIRVAHRTGSWSLSSAESTLEILSNSASPSSVVALRSFSSRITSLKAACHLSPQISGCFPGPSLC